MRDAERTACFSLHLHGHKQQDRNQQDTSRDHGLPRKFTHEQGVAAERPQPKRHRRREHRGEHQPFERTRAGHHPQARPESERISDPQTLAQPPESSQRQTAARCRDRSAPVSIHPVVLETELQTAQHAAEQRPAGRQPGLEHPCQCRAHQADAEPHRPPFMPEQHLSNSEHKALARRIHRHVGRLHQHMKHLEVLPHRRRGIGQPSLGESIGREQITEFVVYRRNRNGLDGQQQKPAQERDRRCQSDRQPACGRDPGPDAGAPRNINQHVIFRGYHTALRRRGYAVQFLTYAGAEFRYKSRRPSQACSNRRCSRGRQRKRASP